MAKFTVHDFARQVLSFVCFPMRSKSLSKCTKDGWIIFISKEVYPHRGIEDQRNTHILRISFKLPSHVMRPLNARTSFLFM